VKEYLKELEEVVAGSARVLLNMIKVGKTGTLSRDVYPRPDGTEWYKWKYWDVSECPEKKGEIEDRWEDIFHIQYELKFAAKAMVVGRDYFKTENYFGVKKKDFRCFLVTILNHLIVDLTISGGACFACDISGSITDKKSCSGSREVGVRLKHAEYLLIAAIAARDDLKAKCDVLSVVSGVLPLFAEGDPNFSTQHQTRFKSALLLQAKYYFYNYRANYDDCSHTVEAYAHLLAHASPTAEIYDHLLPHALH